MGKLLSYPSKGLKLRKLSVETKAGEPYIRFPEVEEQLGKLLQAAPSNWPVLAREGLDGERVKNEAITYLIREAWLHHEDDVLLKLHDILFDRMAPMICNKAKKLGITDLIPLVEEVQDRIIERLYNKKETAAMAFLEVAFNRAVACEVYKWHRKNGKYWQRIEIDAEPLDENIVQYSRVLSAANINEIENGIAASQILENARKLLADPHFEAFYLHYFKDIPVEAKGDDRASLTQHFRRPARTIYSWLNQAVELIRENLNRRPPQ